MDSKLLREDMYNWWIDRMYLQDVWAVASKHSTDPSTQVGSALVVSGGAGIVLASWNRVPDRVKLTGQNLTVDAKNFCTEHAERSVLFKALKNGLPTEGLHLYCTWAACAECSRAIVEFGIKRVVTLRRLVERTHPRWEKSVHAGLQMMSDSGVDLVGWSGDIGSDLTIRFAGETVTKEVLK
jgi:deoxycytidylate deaminase